MTNRERWMTLTVLIAVVILFVFDIFVDRHEGMVGWHIVLEVMTGVGVLIGIFYVLKGSVELRRSLNQERQKSNELKVDAESWRAQSKKYLDGLSNAIDQQLSDWSLTPAEKEVAFLILKGLSLREIASIRDTTEKTTRVQSMAIYAKSGLSGRSELSAFFLKDLLVPGLEQD